MTASDAHPPSDTEAAGWWADLARPGGGTAWRADSWELADKDGMTPVLVLDPAEARETIAVRLAVEFHEEPYFGHSTDADSCFACADILDTVLAALGGQEGGQP